MAVGVLGKTGRGSIEHFAVDVEQCDMYCASMEAAFGSVGGFCIGSNQIVNHQRLSGAGYCFSASSPPYTVTAALQAMEYIDEKPELCAALREKASTMRALLSDMPGLQVTGKAEEDSHSPLVHLVLKESSGSRDDDEALLLKLANKLYADDAVLVCVPEYIAGERQMPPASLQVCVTVEHEKAEMDKLAKAMRKAAVEVLGVTSAAASTTAATMSRRNGKK